MNLDFLKNSGMSDKFINLIIDTFVTDSTIMLQHLKDLHNNENNDDNNNDLIFRAAHKLKSSCEIFDIRQIVNKCVGLEKYISENKEFDDSYIKFELSDIIGYLENALNEIENLKNN